MEACMHALKWILGLVLIFVAMALFFTLRTPTHLYAISGKFTDCPARPSCVSSIATDEPHAIAPLRVAGDPDTALSLLAQHVSGLPGARIEHIKPGYVHAVFVSPTMRFHDDLELLAGDDPVIHVRSISRFGYRDFGVNRDRVEALRAWLEAEQNRPTGDPPEG
jgi:uncharacterized protein (DUF1499 family)